MAGNKSSMKLKSFYKPVGAIETIYTGGKVAFYNDGQYLVTSLEDNIVISDLHHNLQKVALLEGDGEVVTTFVITPDDKYLVAASRSLRMYIWDLATYKLLRSFKAHDTPVLTMDADPSSTLVATGSADSGVRVWDIEGGYCTHNFKGHSGLVSAVKFHPDHLAKQWLLVSGSDQGVIKLWNLRSSRCVATFNNHVSVIRGLDFTADGQFLVSGSRDKTINVWDVRRQILLRTLPVYESVEAVGLLKSDFVLALPDQKLISTVDQPVIYMGGEHCQIRLVDFTKGHDLYRQAPPKKTGEESHQISDLIYDPKRNQLTTVTTDQNIMTYEFCQPEHDQTRPGTDDTLMGIRQIPGYNDEIIDVVYVGPQQTHIVVASNSEKLRTYNLNRFDCHILDVHQNTVLCLDVSADGQWFVAGAKDHTASVWCVDLDAVDRRQQFKQVALCVGHTESVGTVALAKDKGCTFLLTSGQDRTVKYWDLTKVTTIQPKTQKINTRDDDQVASLVTRYTVLAHDKEVNTLAVAPRNKFFATGSQDKTIKVWSAADGKQVGTCTGHRRGVWKVEFSPVDQVLASGAGDKTIRLWSMKDFSCLKTFEGHTSSVVNLNFLTAGLQLVSVGSDAMVKLWTIKSNECVLTADQHEDKIWALAVAKDETRMVTGGGDSIIRLWEDFTQKELDRLHKEQAEYLSQEQDLANYVRTKDYRRAITLALQLDKPRQLYSMLEVVRSEQADPQSGLGSIAIEKVLGSLSEDQLTKLLSFIREWNTNTRWCEVSQATLKVILEHYSPDTLLKTEDIRAVLDALIPYSERHYQRMDNMLTQSFMVDYTLHAMARLAPLEDDVEV
ncbi:U3 small nucleolar RNA-associated protein 13 [Dispira simplex]|nr:U3 small nucleolar RNA-associated protein 13 [Dispira simplex]